MTAEQWARVKDLFQVALEMPESERERFLESASANDSAVRAEVRSLLANAQASGFSEPLMPTPPVAPRSESVSTGDTLGHYRVLHRLGSGGMGDVYAADDTKLQRRVALKVLPQVLALDPEWRKRFEREARAVAALNHPNIVTIYSVENAGEVPFITMELVQGQPLSAIVPRHGLPLDRILELGTAIADAVSAAHQQGIIHRDLKPANVMVSDDGRVKVLDFGLAKVHEQTSALPTSGATASQQLTGEGRILGTVSYMSPEQTEGHTVDERSDVFSLGVMLYEMATGERPFKGSSNVSILSAILRDTPPPISRLNPALPPELGRIVERALAKDANHRFQTANDLRHDLVQVRQQTDPTSRGAILGLRDRVPVRVTVRGVLVTVVALTLIGGAGVALTRFVASRTSQALPFEHFQMTRLTTSGDVTGAAISGDGRFVVYVVADGGQSSLWIRQTATTSSARILPPADVFYRGITVSPDGNYVYFTTYPKDQNVASLYKVPVLGGTPQQILHDIDTPVAFSSDAKRFAFVRGFVGGEAIVIANVDGTGETTLARRELPRAYALSPPAWSPDDRMLAVVGKDRGSPDRSSILALSVADGRERLITEQGWRAIRGLAWQRDGRGLLVEATLTAGTVPSGQIWYVPFAGGDPRRITNDLDDYSSFGVTADAHSIVTVQADSESHLWVADRDGGHATRITSGARSGDGFGGLTWTPDGKIVYVSRAADKPDIWMADADGGNRTQLTSDPSVNSDPAVTPDGQYLLFTSRRPLTPHVYRMKLAGGVPTPLTHGSGEFTPMPSPDGKWVYFATFDPAAYFRGVPWKVSIDGGEPIKVSDTGIQALALSPDGKVLAGSRWDDGERRMRLTALHLGNQERLQLFALGVRIVAWTPDGRLTYAETVDGIGNVWQLPLDGGQAVQLTHFESERILAFAWSPDGKKFAAARGKVTSDVVMITDTQNDKR